MKMFGFIINSFIGHKYKVIKRIPGFHYAPNIYGASWNKLHDPREDKEFFELATKVRKCGTTSLYYDRLYTFYQLINQLKPKTILEAGVYKGGSAYFMASLAPEAEFYAVDTFEGFKAEDNPDGHNSVGVFGDVSYEGVKFYLKPLKNVKVIKGRIQETGLNRNFDLIHLDMDIYEPTKWALDNCKSKFIVVDDYNTISCPGIKKAVDEFLKENNYLCLNLLNGQAILIKI